MRVCSVCDLETLQLVPVFVSLRRISSDCKPLPAGGGLAVCQSCGTVQKPITEQWESEASAIYQNYTPFHQTSGGEPKVFNAGSSHARSAFVLEQIQAERQLPEAPKVLDVGAGTGVFLKACSERFPKAQLYAYDLDTKHLSDLKKITGFKTLYTEALESIEAGFDLIALSHCLEHVPVPLQMLKTLRGLLKPEGVLLVQVPDTVRNPLDLLIADHRTHFSRISLRRLAESAGFSVLNTEPNWKATELSFLLKPSSQRGAKLKDVGAWSRTHGHIEWLQAWEDMAFSEAAGVAVFGTGLGAAWLQGYLGDKITCYVDEDKERVGGTFLGKPIISTQEVSSEMPIYLPLADCVAQQVFERLGSTAFNWKTPVLACLT